MKRVLSFRHTLYASYIAYIVQAIVNNFFPLLVITLQKEYAISQGAMAIILSYNFVIQLSVDLLSALFLKRLGYRKAIYIAHTLAFAGLAGLSFLPDILPPFTGIMVAVTLSAMGGGLIEVVISPTVEAVPESKQKETAMGLLHSFYCWGQALTIVLTTVFFLCFTTALWRVMALLWSLIPLCNLLYYRYTPITELEGEGGLKGCRNLLHNKLFWLMFILVGCAGGFELAVAQWASAFTESALHLPKALGDLAGPCAFALLMGIVRSVYAAFASKIDLKKLMLVCGLVGTFAYLLIAFAPNPLFSLMGCALVGMAVAVLWPGTYSLAAKYIPAGGSAMFGLLAFGGDMGCSSGPGLVGGVAALFGDDLRMGFAFAALFPLVLTAAVCLLMYTQKRNKR